jgi:RNA polymerase sigma factor (sigma-70 family)
MSPAHDFPPGNSDTRNGHNVFIRTRRSLLHRIKDWNDQNSWEEFFNTYWRLIHRAAIRAGLTNAEAQDVVQETVLLVAKAMPGFSYNPAIGSFKNWLLRATRWKISDQYRKRIPIALPRPAYPPVETSPSSIDPDTLVLSSVWEDLWDQNLFEAACDRVKAMADAKQFQIFHLYAIKGWSARKVAAAFRVHPARVYLAKHRISRLIRAQVERLGQPGIPL